MFFVSVVPERRENGRGKEPQVGGVLKKMNEYAEIVTIEFGQRHWRNFNSLLFLAIVNDPFHHSFANP
jgi:hypothetical protein